MDSKRSLKISLNLYLFQGVKHPRKAPLPDGVNKKWVPQSLFDCIWWLVEFESPEMRDDFLGNLPAFFEEARISTPDQDFYDKWAEESKCT